MASVLVNIFWQFASDLIRPERNPLERPRKQETLMKNLAANGNISGKRDGTPLIELKCWKSECFQISNDSVSWLPWIMRCRIFCYVYVVIFIIFNKCRYFHNLLYLESSVHAWIFGETPAWGRAKTSRDFISEFEVCCFSQHESLRLSLYPPDVNQIIVEICD